MKRYDSQHAYDVGYAGEEAVAEILKGKGYQVEAGGNGDCDLTLEGICTVEVKTANASGRTDRKAKRWQFCLFAHPERDKPFAEDLLILRCETTPPTHFVIPGVIVLRGTIKIDITTKDPAKYRGKWAFYRERWDLIDTVLKWCKDRG